MKKQKGFTLIELLVVIAIIGVLSTLAVVALNSARAKSRDARRVSDVKQIQTALELFYNEAGGYPASTTPGGQIVNGANVFMEKVPTGPTPADGTCTTTDYVYTATGTASGGLYASYDLEYCLGGNTGGVAAGIHTASPAGIEK